MRPRDPFMPFDPGPIRCSGTPIADPAVPPFHATGLFPSPPCPRGASAVPFGLAAAVFHRQAALRSTRLPSPPPSKWRPPLTPQAVGVASFPASPNSRPISARLSAASAVTRLAPPPRSRALRASPLSTNQRSGFRRLHSGARGSAPSRPSRLSPLSANQLAGFRRLHGDALAPPPSLSHGAPGALGARSAPLCSFPVRRRSVPRRRSPVAPRRPEARRSAVTAGNRGGGGGPARRPPSPSPSLIGYNGSARGGGRGAAAILRAAAAAAEERSGRRKGTVGGGRGGDGRAARPIGARRGRGPSQSERGVGRGAPPIPARRPPWTREDGAASSSRYRPGGRGLRRGRGLREGRGLAAGAGPDGRDKWGRGPIGGAETGRDWLGKPGCGLIDGAEGAGPIGAELMGRGQKKGVA